MKMMDTMEKLVFVQVKEEKVNFLKEHHLMSLATSLDDRVTVRTVTYASQGLNIYFLSCGYHTKCVQIQGNPNVALCIGNVQVEGNAKILGNPLAGKNQVAAEIYRQQLPEVFANFAPNPEMVLVKVKPTLFATFVKNPERNYLEHLDTKNRIAYIFEEFH